MPRHRRFGGFVIVACGCALLASLGVWQWRRGLDKEALLAAFAAAAAAPSLALRVDSPPPPDARVVPAAARGAYRGDRQLLLDNQTHDGRPGYRVLTPLALESGGLLLVDRGWTAQDPDRRVLPAIGVASTASQEIRGLWRALPRAGLALVGDACAAAGWPRVVHYPTVEDLSCIYGAPVADGVLLLDPAAPDGYVRDWAAMTVSIPPLRHYGYAAQWFALSVTLAIAAVILARRT